MGDIHRARSPSNDRLYGGGRLMREGWKAAVLAMPLFFTAACGQSDEVSESMEMKQVYSLCPDTEDARQRLSEQVRNFANQQQAQLIDRSAGVQRELSGLKSDVLENTGGDSFLITVKKPDEFLVSVTNLGLKEKFVLTVTSWGETSEDSAVNRFKDDLRRFWTFEEVDGGVTDDPPC
jgi:hypothetical protein